MSLKTANGNYQFQVFDFGERGTHLSGALISEIGHDLLASVRDTFGDVDAIVAPEPGGHTWGLLLAFALSVDCHILRAPSAQVPDPGETVVRETAYSTSLLISPTTIVDAHVVIVDDVISSGGTLRTILDIVQQRNKVLGVQAIVAKGQAYRKIAEDYGITISVLQEIPAPQSNLVGRRPAKSQRGRYSASKVTKGGRLPGQPSRKPARGGD